MRYKIFGCKTNKYYTEKWLGSERLSGKKGVFVASCVVTDKAKSKWLRFVKQELRTLEADEKIFLSGCGTIQNGSIDNNFYTQYPELASSRDKIELLPEDPENEPSIQVTSEPKKLQSLKSTFANIYTRKYLVVQMGCDNFCTFCLTVQARGRHRSRSLEEILLEIDEFVRGWGKEIVITGINIGAWGASNSNKIGESRFAALIKTILEKTTIERIRISSLGVEFVTDEVIELFRHSRIIAHAHLSIQSGSDAILKAMNRHYDRKKLLDVLEKLSTIRREDGVRFGIGADLIVGFPGETSADFEDTLDLVRSFRIVKVHAFPFSAHTSGYTVPAGTFENQIPEAIKKARLDTLIEVGNERRRGFLQENSGAKLRLLAEKVTPTGFLWWSENYIELDEINFAPMQNSTMHRGGIYEGIFTFDASHSEKQALDF